jgi:methyltransferase
MMLRALVCGFMGLARLVELAWSRKNVETIGQTRERASSRRIYPLILLVHTTVIVGTLLFGARRVRWPWLSALVAVQPLRYWILLTLGRRWNARGAVPIAMEVATDGPYAYVRHPNYSVVIVELASLPLAFGLGRLAAVATIVNCVLLAVRIREEESLLFELPGYREHFEDRARFVPGLV